MRVGDTITDWKRSHSNVFYVIKIFKYDDLVDHEGVCSQVRFPQKYPLLGRGEDRRSRWWGLWR